MKKTICRVEYDTDTAEVIAKYTHGVFGDPEGYEEVLYRTEKGNYFEYANGGAASKHPVESISRIAKNKAQAWIDAHK